MTDETVAEATAPDEAKIVQVLITKAKQMISVDTNLISDETFGKIVLAGLADYLNRGMSKITVKDLEGADLDKAKAAAFAKAEENLKAVYEGKIKAKGEKGSTASTKHSREVTTEAMRLARDIIKDHIRADGGKPSHYKASDISKWAKELLEADPSYYEMATANLESRKTKPVAINLGGLKADPALVEKAEKRKAAAKPKAGGQLSAKQAGKVAPPRQKPGTQPTAH